MKTDICAVRKEKQRKRSHFREFENRSAPNFVTSEGRPRMCAKGFKFRPFRVAYSNAVLQQFVFARCFFSCSVFFARYFPFFSVALATVTFWGRESAPRCNQCDRPSLYLRGYFGLSAPGMLPGRTPIFFDWTTKTVFPGLYAFKRGFSVFYAFAPARVAVGLKGLFRQQPPLNSPDRGIHLIKNAPLF